MVINKDHYIDELRHNIKNKDSIKAAIIIDHLEKMDEDVQHRTLFELSRAEDDFAIPLLAKMYDKKNELSLKIEQLEEILDSKIEEYPFALIHLLQDKTINNPEKYIYLAGKLQCNNSVDLIINFLHKSSDSRFLKICIEALGEIGNPRVNNIIADFLYSGQRDLTVAAIKALTELGTPDAVSRLSERFGTDYEFDRMILEAFARIRDQKSLEILNKMLLSNNVYHRNFAIAKLTEIGAKSIPVIIDNLSSKNSDLLIHTLTILGNIGDISAAQSIRKLLFDEPQNANVRFAAYEALGKFPLHKGTYVLTAGLLDPEEQVHIAVAKALERNLNKTVIAGIKNMLRGSEEEVQQIVTAFINAEADEIIKQLIDYEPFSERALSYLKTAAHPDIRNHFIVFFQKQGLGIWSRVLDEVGTERKDKENLLIYAIDDSRMILRFYKSTLHQLGYPSQLFEFPESAIEQIKEHKPSIVFTDLNMPNMNGIMFTKEIRKIYSKEVLPVIMVTTQQDTQDKDAAFSAGINALLYKPFKKEQIKEVLTKFL